MKRAVLATRGRTLDRGGSTRAVRRRETTLTARIEQHSSTLGQPNAASFARTFGVAMSSWYDAWADRYEDFSPGVGADVPFYVGLAHDADGPLVELADGTGRVAIP